MAQIRQQAMGTEAHVVVDCPDDEGRAEELATRGIDRIDELEQRWSRFLPDSDIGRANATRGIPVDVAPETRLLVRQAMRASELTGGRYDPTILDALVAAGYDQDLAAVRSCGPAPDNPAHPVPGCRGIEVDDAQGTITLPSGSGFDPGGIGKGLAADLVAEELMAAGATGVLISIGGDARTVGTPRGGGPWIFEIEETTVSSAPIAQVALSDGAIATSTNRRRVWATDAGDRHHVIDPRTGDSADCSAQLVTVLAADAWWAEALATTLMLTDPADWARTVGVDAALIVDLDGRLHELGRVGNHVL